MFGRKHQFELSITLGSAAHFKARGREGVVLGAFSGFLDYLDEELENQPAEKEKLPIGFASAKRADIEELEADTQKAPADVEVDEDGYE